MAWYLPITLLVKSVQVDIVIGINLCVRGWLEVKEKGIRRVGGTADKEVCIFYTANFISQQQFFVAAVSFPVLKISEAYIVCSSIFFPHMHACTHTQAKDVGKAQCFAWGTIM
jgi:hypothetical protein